MEELGTCRNRKNYSKFGKRWIQASSRKKTPTFPSPKRHHASGGNRKEKSLIDNSTRITEGQSYRNSSQYTNTRILQPFLHNTKIYSGEVATNSGSQAIQSFHVERSLQDGDSRVNQAGSPDWRLGHFPGLHLSLSPYSHPSNIQEISQVQHQRDSLPIPSASDGIDVIRSDIHKSDKVCARIVPGERYSPLPVFRRLADKRVVQRNSKETYVRSSTAGTDFGLQTEHREVRVGTKASDDFSGISILSESGDGSSDRGKMAEDLQCSRPVLGQLISSGTNLAVVDRSIGIDRETCTSWDVASPTHSKSSNRGVVSHLSRAGRIDRDNPRGESRAGVVERQGEDPERSSHERARGSVYDLHRCFGPRLGRSPGRVGSSRHLGRSRSEPPYQRKRDVECVIRPFSLQGFAQEEGSYGGNRQLDSNALHQKARRYKVQELVAGDPDVIRIPGTIPDSSEMQAYCREPECQSRQTLKNGTNSSNRMEPESEDFGPHLVKMGEAPDRPVCDKRLQTTPTLRVSSTRQGSLGSGCFKYQLGQNVCLCISSNGHSSQGTTEDKSLGLRDSAHSAGLDATVLVCNDTGTSSGLAVSSPSLAENVETAQINHIPQSPRNLQSSCIQIIQQSHEDQGFSAEAASRMAKCQKDSTLAVYQGKWNIFNDWCKSKNISSTHAQVTEIADFLCYLRTDRDLAASTIEGYRTAIGHVIKAVTGREIGKDSRLTSLINNLARTGQVKKSLVPNWDLSLVLNTMTKSPFEPMHLAEMKYLTLKTVFLLALASGRRRGEIHALQADIQHSEHWKEITIFTDPAFVSKTELRVKGAEPLKPLVLKALTKILGPDMQEDRSLCVVRAVKFYLSRTEEVRQGRKRLFLAYKKGHTSDISKNTISSWIRKAIILAYEKSGKEDQQLAGVRAHDVRGMASSWALLKNASLNDILQACSWKSHSTFTRFYLKDLTRIQGELLKLGPVNTALHTS